MRVIVDILHPAHLNFYKRAIDIMQQRNWHLTVLVRDRGDLVEFARRELNVPIRVVGKHYKNRLGKCWGLVHRVVYLVLERFWNPYDVITSHGGFYAAIAATLTKRRSVIFYDNCEYRMLFYLCRRFASLFVVPSGLGSDGRNIKTFYGYKELAYLNNLVPSEEVLMEYQVEKQQYVLIRHIAHISLDYWKHDHETSLERVLRYCRNRDYKVIASVEHAANQIPLLYDSPNVTVIRKSTSKLHTLIYYAKCVVSSGDTVAREAALLGVPSIYIGKRDMLINRELIRMNLLHWPSEETILSQLRRCLDESTVLRQSRCQWEDTTDVILQNLTVPKI